MSPTMVPGYRHRPGNHCGSTALRNLLAFGGVEISEEMALGLGAGVCFYYVAVEGESPSRFTNGRVGRLEEQFLELTGLPLRLATFEQPAESWEAARRTVAGGLPALLLTDLYYLDHYGTSAHFPGHAVVLAGFDDEVAYLSDTGFEQLQTTRLANLARARHGRHPIFPLDGHMLTLAGGELDDPRGAAGGRDRARREPDDRARARRVRGASGAAALRRRGRLLAQQIYDWQWSARFCYQVIERRGTGGGNFRLMYSRFLAEAGHDASRDRGGRGAPLDGARRDAAEPRASPSASPTPALGTRRRPAGAVLEAEQRLWTALAAHSAPRRGSQAISAGPPLRSVRGRRTLPGHHPRRSAAASGGSSRRVEAVEDARVDVGAATYRGGIREIVGDALDGAR